MRRRDGWLLAWTAAAGLLMAGCTGPRPADVAVVSGQVLTVDSTFSRAEAVAIRDGVLVAVGSNSDIEPFIGTGTRVIDAGGRPVIPGLIETHVHALRAARSEAERPFVQLRSIEEIREWLRREAARTPPGRWIRLPRVDLTLIRERRMPTRQDLDEAAPDHPAVFHWEYANRQAQVLNTAALEAAGITSRTEPPPGGRIHLREDGEPTGVIENSGELLSGFLTASDVPADEHLASLERLLRIYTSMGITSIFERNTTVEGYRTYEALKSQGRLPVRVTTTIGLDTDGSVAGTEEAIRRLPFKQTGDGDAWLKVGPLKVRVDGGVRYGTAYLRTPYGPHAFSLYGFDDPAYQGDLLTSVEQLTNIIRTGHRLGWQLSAHVAGDAGVDAVLDALEAASAGLPRRDHRYTLIHAYFPNAAAAERASRLGVVVDTQPVMYHTDGEALVEALGTERVRAFMGVHTWQQAGVKVAINSDHMYGFGPESSLNPFDPFLTMYAAHTRKTDGGRVIGPEQRISREDALRAMTIDAAWLSFDEENRGSLEVGKLGDLAVLSDDLLTCDEDRIKDIRALVTIAGGRIVHQEAAETGS